MKYEYILTLNYENVGLGPVQELNVLDSERFVWSSPQDIGQCNILYGIYLNDNNYENIDREYMEFDGTPCTRHSILIIPVFHMDSDESIYGTSATMNYMVPGKSNFFS